MRGPAEAAKLLPTVVPVEMPPRSLVEVLQEIIMREAWLEAGEMPEELAEKWEIPFRLRVRANIEGAMENSQFLQYELSTANENYIQGSCFIGPTDDEKIVIAKKNRAKIFSYLEEFKSLTPSEFETLCGRILSLLNVEEEFVTQASADQGIDFFGRVPFGELMKPSAITPGAEKQLKIWMVGQAKHYKSSQVSTKDIRELVGSISLAKSKIYAGSKDPLARLEMRTCDPVFFLFFTTGSISRDALDLLRKSGVVAMDGRQLAMFLADNGIGIEADEFDHVAFRAWLDA